MHEKTRIFSISTASWERNKRIREWWVLTRAGSCEIFKTFEQAKGFALEQAKINAV